MLISLAFSFALMSQPLITKLSVRREALHALGDICPTSHLPWCFGTGQREKRRYCLRGAWQRRLCDGLGEVATRMKAIYGRVVGFSVVAPVAGRVEGCRVNSPDSSSGIMEAPRSIMMEGAMPVGDSGAIA
jgi:hypothetical protein